MHDVDSDPVMTLPITLTVLRIEILTQDLGVVASSVMVVHESSSSASWELVRVIDILELAESVD